MNDLISRDFIKSLGGECIAARDSKTHELLPISNIDVLPSAQPEIIHCQDCKYAKENQGELWICAHPDNNAWRITKEFYCGRAERREE